MPASKALKHKEGNKHRFLTFAERLSKVSINAVHHIVRTNEHDDTDDSKFHGSLVKWRDQDRSIPFREFYSEVINKSQNFKMVVHYSSDIMASMQKHLSVPDSLALEALCELLVALCIDLRSEIYPFFNDLFVILTKLLNAKALDRLEWVFNAISLLFKYLWKYMIADMEGILSLYRGLICNVNPSHIATFAAESLTFLIRKVSNQDKFYENLFRLLATSGKGEEGVGKILFHVLKSTKGNLYSRAESILPKIFNCLTLPDLNSSSTFNCVDIMINLLASHVEKDHAQVIWNLLMDRLKNSKESDLIHMLKLMNAWCSCRNGYLILNPDDITNVVKNLLKNTIANEAIESFINLCVTLTTTENKKFEASLKENLIKTAVATGKFDLTISVQFWENILSFVNLNTTARQIMLKFCQVHIQDLKHEIVHLLTTYVFMNYEMPKDAKELSLSKHFNIDYALISREQGTARIQDVLKSILQDETTEDSLLFSCLLLLQHIRPNSIDALKILGSLFERLQSNLGIKNGSQSSLPLMRMTLQTIILMNHESQDKVLLKMCNSQLLLTSLITNYCRDQNALFILDILLFFTKFVVSELKDKLELCDLYSNLSCSDSMIRKFSLRILTALYPNESIFKTCLMIEETPATVQTYRAKALHLAKLKYSTGMSIEISKAVLRFLISNLFINFSSYWPLVQDAVSSFMPDDGKNELWVLFFDLLNAASIPTSTEQQLDTVISHANITDELPQSLTRDAFEEHGLKISLSSEANSKPDFFNYRLLFLKMLGQFPHVNTLEKNNRHLVTLFINYLDNEYYKVDKSYAPHQDITERSLTRNKKMEFSILGKKHAVKTLNAILNVLCRFRNPSACAETKKLKSIYMSLLMHGEGDIQLSALKCLFTYREKSLLGFKEQLMALLDDDKIKETMLQFNLSEVEDDKRNVLIPVLFRLMYGRMISKSGVGGQGRRRRSAVLRFLSALKQDEMQAFIFLSIEPVRHYVDENQLYKSLDDSFCTGCDLNTIVPLSRQRGILNTVSEMIEKHANLLSNHMFDFLLKLLLSMNLSYSKLIGSTTESNESLPQELQFVPFLRSLCKQTHVSINCLIESWPEAECLKSDQIESLFFVLVDSSIEKLQHECISKPNSLLHLLNRFSMKSKFVPLLGRKLSSGLINSPIQALITTLVSDKTSNAVSRVIMEMCIRMIGDENDNVDSDNTDDKLIENTITNMGSNIVINVQNFSHVEVGSKLLSEHVADIMKFFISKLQQRKNSGGLVHSHLKLLAVLGTHITDIDLSHNLIKLLLDHVSGASRIGKKSVPEDNKSILPALVTINALPLHSKFLPTISKLFSRIKSRNCRLMLAEIFSKSCATVTEGLGITLKRVASIVRNMNAWDKRFIEELDYDSRLIAFQELNNWLGSEDACELLDHDYISMLPIVHNCVYTLATHCNDLSLRESATRALEQIISLVFKNMDNSSYVNVYHTIISMVILPGIRKGLNSIDENQRHEWLRLLVKISKLSESDSGFSSLNILSNESDPDADFYSNVQHIQLHRRTRAFRKLAQVISRQDDENTNVSTTIPYNMISSYLLPLAMQSLKNLDLCKHLHLRDACLDVVGSCARVMPWNTYLKFLRQTMTTKLQLSQGIRILCSVLDSFHFNISITEVEALKLESAYKIAKSKKIVKILEEDTENLNHDKNVLILDTVDEETATIYTTMTCDILPRLSESLSGKMDSDSNHKLADSTNYSDIDQCTIRAPLAVAVVSLLQKLPTRVLNSHLSTVLLKIVAFLRHQYIEVRTVASKIIVQIADLLDPCHLPIIIRELKCGLTRGYQKHVLMHTVSCVFSKLESKFKVGDLEASVGLVIKVLIEDLFGKSEEERGIDKIKTKTPEARGRSKAYNMFKIFAKFVQKKSLSSLIVPLKVILDATSDHRKRKTVDAALFEIGQGLQDNSGLSAEDILIFLHGLLTENLPGLFQTDEAKNKGFIKSKPGSRGESCLLLSTEPERYGVKQTKKTQKTNLHLLIEFAIRFLNSSIKRQVILVTNTEHLQMLDPFVNILKHCLESAHSKTITEATRCLTKLFKSSLPGLSENAVDIIKSLFKILRENSKGSVNNELAAATYKALSILCVSELGSKISDTQLQVLLAYAEEMLYERDRQSHAFNLIQSILNRGLQCEEIIQVMKKIRDICIQTHDSAAMVHARQVYMYFLTHYPLTKTILFKHLEFVLAQLTFEFEAGRLSSLELIASIISSFSGDMIKTNSGIVFVPISVMLVNDESVKCRKIAAHVVKMLLNKLEVNGRDQLFSLVIQWFEDNEHPIHQQLAAILVTVFAEAEDMEFGRRLSELIPVFSEVIHSAVGKLDQEEDISEDNDNNEDHFLFHQLSALHSIIRVCQLAQDTKWDEQINLLLHSTENVLLHPHMWVRIISSQIFGTIFAAWDPQDLLSATKETKQCSYLTSDLKSKLKTLGILFCKQIQSPILDTKLTDQCIKNLLYVVKVQHLEQQKNNANSKENTINDDIETSAEVDGALLPKYRKNAIMILLLQLSKTAKLESANDIKETSKRTAILKFFAALCISLKGVDEYLHIILDPVYRESERKIVEEDKVANSLKTLAGEVLGVIKSKIGSAAFTTAYAKVQKRAISLRRDRKRKHDVELVADPQKAAASKTRRQLKKKDQRKRKIATLRPDSGAALRKRKKNFVVQES